MGQLTSAPRASSSSLSAAASYARTALRVIPSIIEYSTPAHNMSDCDNCDAKKAAFEACMLRESTSLSGMKYFGSGAIVGAALTLAVPRGVTSVWIRQAPFFVLGLSGIAADYYAIQSLCARESG